MKYVVIGASAAGINGVEHLRRLDKDSEITLISKDSKVYSRCMLHHYISGHRTIEQLSFIGQDFFDKNNIQWLQGIGVEKIIPSEYKVILEDKTEVKYDKLLIASGSKPFIPPIENLRGNSNVIGLKTLNDCDNIIKLAKNAKKISIIGAGLIGFDALTGLLDSKDVSAKLSLIETSNRLLPIQLDKQSSETYEKKLLENDIALYLDSMVSSATSSNGRVDSLILKDGRVIDTDLVIVATGVRSNIEFIKDTEIELSKFGLIFNERGETNIKDIYGAGDVSGVAPIWPVAVKEGIIAASNMTGNLRVMDDFFTSKATMNFFNIPTLTLGDSTTESEELINNGYTVDTLLDFNGNYKKIVHKSGVIYGAVIQGDLSYAGILTQLIKMKINISKIKKPIFDIDYSDFFHINNKLEFEY